jgi:Ca2+-binding RTX toxin-like protein
MRKNQADIRVGLIRCEEAPLPTRIAIEARPLDIGGINSGFVHLYLVKTETDSRGRVLSEKVIRGSLESGDDLGALANVDLASSPDRRGSDRPAERHRTFLDLGGRNADDVWKVMAQHALNIDRAELPYSFDIFRQLPGADLNSNSVIASVLHSVGIDWSASLPAGISRSEAPLYGQLQSMAVNDTLSGTGNRDRILGGAGHDRIHGGAQNDALYGETGNDRLYGGSGRDTLISGSGQDAFVFNTTLNATTNIDTIRDFSVANDTIWLENSVFRALGSSGRLKAGAFRTGDEARDSSDRIIYDRDDGVLYYDADGAGAGKQVAFAKLSAALSMTSLDFLVI